jgi:hypothetical protein
MAPQKNGKIISHPFKELTDSVDVLGRKWPEGRYLINGFFQHSEWYHPRRTAIEAFASPDSIGEVNKKDIVVHIRLGDYPRQTMIHPRWYIEILEKEKFECLYIVTEARDDSYLRYFSKYSPKVVFSSVKDDWNFIRRFDRIICSNSTFCWWAAFFSLATKIFTFKRWVGSPQYDLSWFPNGMQVDGPFLTEESYAPEAV